MNDKTVTTQGGVKAANQQHIQSVGERENVELIIFNKHLTTK